MKNAKRLVVVLLAVVVFVLLWFWTNRLLVPANAVKVFHSPVQTPARTSQSSRLTVLSYNIQDARGPEPGRKRWGREVNQERPQRLKDIAAFLREIDADVVVLNEVDFDCVWSRYQHQAAILADLAGYPYRAEQRNVDASTPFFKIRVGNAVLSRYPIAEAELIDLPPVAEWRALFAVNERAMRVTLQLNEGRTVQVAAVHFPSLGPEEIRVQCAEKIRSLPSAQETPLIVAGDFNSTKVGFPGAYLTEDGITSVSFLEQDGGFRVLPESSPKPADLTFPSRNPFSVIDWIMVRGPVRVSEYKVIRSELSDHLPVLAEFQMDAVVPKESSQDIRPSG